MISIELTIHNKAELVNQVLWGIISNASRAVNELVIVLDGCTDSSDQKVEDVRLSLEELGIRPDIEWKVLETPDVFETLANNEGLRYCNKKNDYVVIVQDDCIINEPGFDLILMMPYIAFPGAIFAVSGRKAHNNRTIDGNGTIEHVDLIGEEHGNLSFGEFVCRDVCIRGPLMIRLPYFRDMMGLFPEKYAPYTLDDHASCYLAKKKYGLSSGVTPIRFESRPEWGTTRQKNQTLWQKTFERNCGYLIEDYGEFMGYKYIKEKMRLF